MFLEILAPEIVLRVPNTGKFLMYPYILMALEK